MAEERIGVLVVDDDPNFIEATRAMLSADQRLEVVGAARSGEEAVAKAASLHPRVVAMDVVMPGMDGFEAARKIRKHEPECQVVLVSGSIFVERDEEGVDAARAAGAAAYVAKSRAPLDLAETVVSVAHASGDSAVR